MAYCQNCGKLTDQCACHDRSRSNDRRRPRETEEPDFWSKLERMVGKSSDKVIETLGPRIDNVETKQVELSAKHDALAQRVDDLEFVTSSGNNSTFVPGFLEIKNFCDYDDRRRLGASRPQAEELVNNLKAVLPDTIQCKVGDVALTGGRVHKIKVHVTKGFAIEIAGVWREELEKATRNFNERKLFITIERPPEEQAIYSKAGKAMAFLRSKVTQVEVKCTWQPDFNLEVDDKVVGSIGYDAAITWNAAGLAQACGDLTSECADRELARFRSGGKA